MQSAASLHRYPSYWQSLLSAIRRIPPLAMDAVIVALLIYLDWISVIGPAQRNMPGRSQNDMLLHELVVVGAVLPLLLRRRFPVLTLGLMAALIGMAGSLGPWLAFNPGPGAALGLGIATYTAVAATGGLVGLVCLSVSLIVVTLVLRPWEAPIAAWLPNLPGQVVAYAAGRVQRQNRMTSEILERRVVDVEAQQERHNALAVQAARVELAGELHDVVSRGIHEMAERARDALTVLDREAADAEPSLVATEEAGRHALAEMRRLLHVLRSDGNIGGRRPQPDLGSLDDLVRHTSWVMVDLRVEGEASSVPAPVALAAYRIVEEALDNARQHSDADRVTARVDVAGDSLAIEVRDNGRPLRRDRGLRAGLGIVGMRERAALFGGALEAGPDPSGGYAVVARLPFESPDRGRAAAGQRTFDRAAAMGPESGASPRALSARLRRSAAAGWLLDVALVATISVGVYLEMEVWQGLLAGVAPLVTFSPAAYAWNVTLVFWLLLRRPAPIVAAVGLLSMLFLQTYPFAFWTPSIHYLAVGIGLYSVARRYPWRPHAWLLVPVFVVAAVSVQSISPPLWALIGINTLSMLAAVYVGTIVGERARLNSLLSERLTALAEERQAELELAIRRDRLALAREMHDLVAHTLSLMVVQAGAARTVAKRDAAAARRAINAVITAGGKAAGELHQLFSLLRTETSDVPLLARAGDVADLIEQARQAGLDVRLEVSGRHRPVHQGSLDLSVYRIVQEALTNARKHAPGSRVDVRLEYGRDKVAVRVENKLARASPSDLGTLGGGHGLLGMRERVAMFGGQFEAGRVASGAFVVNALLPAAEAVAG